MIEKPRLRQKRKLLQDKSIGKLAAQDSSSDPDFESRMLLCDLLLNPSFIGGQDEDSSESDEQMGDVNINTNNNNNNNNANLPTPTHSTFKKQKVSEGSSPTWNKAHREKVPQQQR